MGEQIRSTCVAVHIFAPRAVVYRALLDARSIATWRVPEGMSGEVHSFDAREGGLFRVSLIYDEPSTTGKTSALADTYHGHFAKLVHNEQVIEVLEFESIDPQLQGEMTITTTLCDAGGGTDVVVLHEGLPVGVSAADNATGTRMALAHLAELVEAEDSLLDPG